MFVISFFFKYTYTNQDICDVDLFIIYATNQHHIYLDSYMYISKIKKMYIAAYMNLDTQCI